MASPAHGAGGGGGRRTPAGLGRSEAARRRDASADEVIERLRPSSRSVAGARLFLHPAQELRVGGRPSNAQYQYHAARRQHSTSFIDWTRQAPRHGAAPEQPDARSTSIPISSERRLETLIVIDRDTDVAARPDARAGRQHALRRVRPTAGFDDLQRSLNIMS